MADDALTSIDDLQKKQFDMEDKFNQMIRYLEDKIRQNSNGNHNNDGGASAGDTFKISS